jgi:hypothetical protein
VLSCCCRCRCTTPVVPPGNHMHNLISYPHSMIHFIITILTANTGLSFNYSFPYIFCSLISSINIVILYPTMVIILFFIFELLLYWTVTVLNRFCLELLLYWTVTVFVFKSLLSWTVTVLNCYCFVFEQLLSSEVAFRPFFRFLTIYRVLELHFKRDWSHWKANTRGYKSSEGRRTHFCL